MPDPLVYVDAPPDDVGAEVTIEVDDDHHLRNVLRLRPGDPVVVGDGRGRTWPAELAGERTLVTTGPAERTPVRRPQLHVVQALPKGRKVDEIVRSLVELGVERITPVSSARTVRDLDARKREREHDRWRSVARAAASQARRAWLATVDPLTDLGAVLEEVDRGVVPHVGAATGLAEAAASLREEPTVAVAIGPEGGWTDEEVARLQAAGLVPVTLGDTVLRTEHAAFAAAAALAFAFGRMGGTRMGGARANVD